MLSILRQIISSCKEYFMTWYTALQPMKYRVKLYAQMHKGGEYSGKVPDRHLKLLEQLFPRLYSATILDYGCGSSGGLKQKLGEGVTPYDPATHAHSGNPWSGKYDLIYSTDVLEHLPRREVIALLKTIVRNRPEAVYLNISTRKAYKRLPNGANAHLIVKNGRWWFNLLNRYLGDVYEIVYAREDLIVKEVTIFAQRRS